jgi:creatinine amidohydrolase
MPLPKRDWMEMTWQEIAGAGAETARWIAVLPLAAVEQHGPHLPLGVDTFIAEAYLARVRGLLLESLPITFLPVQRVGVSAEHLSFPGTLTLSAATAIAAWTELGESLARAGLRKLVLVTSHGGNVAAMELVARDLRARLGMLAVTVGWHRFGYPDGTFSEDEKKHGIHGGDIETSLMLAAMPETVRTAMRRSPAAKRARRRLRKAQRPSLNCSARSTVSTFQDCVRGRFGAGSSSQKSSIRCATRVGCRKWNVAIMRV